MWKWFFNKFIIKVREQVVVDLVLNMPARSYEEHLDDFLTMLVRMAVTLLVAFVAMFLVSERTIVGLLTAPLHFAHMEDRIILTNGGYLCGSPGEERLLEANERNLAIIAFVALVSWIVRNSISVCRQSPASPNFK